MKNVLLSSFLNLCVASSSIVITYRPDKHKGLPEHICVDTECVIPRFNVSDHSVSVIWPVFGRDVKISLADDTNTFWSIPESSDRVCYTLVDRAMEEDDNSCVVIQAEHTSWIYDIVVSGRETIGGYVQWLTGSPLEPFVHTVQDLVNLDATMWFLLLVSVFSVFLVSKVAHSRSRTGMLRIGYSDSSRPRDYCSLPCARFPDSLLTEQSIVEAMQADESVSSITLLRYYFQSSVFMYGTVKSAGGRSRDDSLERSYR